MWRVISAIMHLSNLPFVGDGPNQLAKLKDNKTLDILAELMEVDATVLGDAIMQPRVKAGGRDVVKTHLTADKVRLVRACAIALRIVWTDVFALCVSRLTIPWKRWRNRCITASSCGW